MTEYDLSNLFPLVNELSKKVLFPSGCWWPVRTRRNRVYKAHRQNKGVSFEETPFFLPEEGEEVYDYKTREIAKIAKITTVNLPWSELEQFIETQKKIAYDIGRANCQHFAFQLQNIVGCPSDNSPVFERWTLQMQQNCRDEKGQNCKGKTRGKFSQHT